MLAGLDFEILVNGIPQSRRSPFRKESPEEPFDVPE